MKKKKEIKKIYVVSVLIFLSEILLVLMLFRKIREKFPITGIGANGIIGYAQYFGYPFYFETLIFLLITISPIIIVFIVTLFIKKQT